MLTPMNALADASSVVSGLNGWEISGIVAVVIIAGLGLWMLPEIMRYMKIRHM